MLVIAASSSPLASQLPSSVDAADVTATQRATSLPSTGFPIADGGDCFSPADWRAPRTAKDTFLLLRKRFEQLAAVESGAASARTPERVQRDDQVSLGTLSCSLSCAVVVLRVRVRRLCSSVFSQLAKPLFPARVCAC